MTLELKHLLKPWRLKKLGDRIRYLPSHHGTDRPILAAVCGKEATLILDSGNSPAHARRFLAKLAAQAAAPPKYLVLTHYHWDHVFGISTMNLPTIAHRETIRQIEAMSRLKWQDTYLDLRVKQGTEIAFVSKKMKKELSDSQREALTLTIPGIAFQDNMVIDLGGVTCRVEHVGGDHACDSSVVYVPEERVLFLGDCIFMDIYDGPWSYTPEKLLPMVEKILSLDAEIYVPSHSRPLGKQTMVNYLRELETLGRLVEKFQGDRQKIIREIGAGAPKKVSRDRSRLLEYFINGIKKNKNNNCHHPGEGQGE